VVPGWHSKNLMIRLQVFLLMNKVLSISKVFSLDLTR